MAEKEWVSIPTFAKQIGRTPEYIRRLVASGKIETHSQKQIGKRIQLNPESAIQDIKNNISYINKKSLVKNQTKPNQTKPVSENEKKETIKSAKLDKNSSLADIQKLHGRYKAALLKLDLDERKGILVQKEKVEKDAFNIARIVRDSILNIPDRISAELASITDVHVISEKLITELTETLEELSS